MNDNIVKHPFGALIPGWKWRTAKEGEIAPSDMETRHLFYTFRMIWNHSMPTQAHVGGTHRRYQFGPSHNEEYMREAVRHIGAELFNRNDLEVWQQHQLHEMAAWFRDKLQSSVRQVANA